MYLSNYFWIVSNWSPTRHWESRCYSHSASWKITPDLLDIIELTKQAEIIGNYKENLVFLFESLQLFLPFFLTSSTVSNIQPYFPS